MDERFLKDRLATVRELAQRADPFIRRRLLDLAHRYDRQLRQSRAATDPLRSTDPADHPSAGE